MLHHPNVSPPEEIGVAVTTATDTVLQHRAAAQALLEGTSRPPRPGKDAPTKAQIREAFGSRLTTSAPRSRSSLPTSRSSFFSEHFAMSITTTGYGHGIAWTMPDTRHSLQPEHEMLPSRYILFPDADDGSTTTSSSMFAAKSARRRSRMKHSVVNPSLGGGYNAIAEHDETYWEHVLDLIRVLAEAGSLDVPHLISAGVPISDPQLKVALCASLESSPGAASRLIDAIDAHHDYMSEENQPQVMSPLRKARESLQFTARKAKKSLFASGRRTWRDSGHRSSVWSRVSSRISFASTRYDR